MPVCYVSVDDLSELVGRKLDEDLLTDALPRLKCELEKIEGGLVYYEVTHDRPDLFSAEGLARALKGLLRVEVGLREFKIEGVLNAYNEGPPYRPYAFFATVHGMKLSDEAIRQIMQLQEKLHTTYGRNRAKVSIGVYDLSKVHPPIRYIETDPNSVSFQPLDYDNELNLKEILQLHPKGQQYGHLIANREKYPLLIDSNGNVLSLPPIVNSEGTRVTTGTKDVLIDVTATDFRLAVEVLTIVTTSLAERGEKIGLVKVIGKSSTDVPDLSPSQHILNVELVERISGLKVTVEEAVNSLKAMRFGAEPIGQSIRVLCPAYRLDILHPVDLVEEVLMGYGFDKLEPKMMPPQHRGKMDPLEAFSRKIREILIGFGFQEVNNYMLTSKEVLYSKMCLPDIPTVEVLNPRQEAYTCLRTWLTPQLIQVLSRSKHADYPQKIFECGDVIIVDEHEENMVKGERRVALAFSDSRATLTDLHAVVDEIFSLLNLNYELEEGKHPSFIEGRFATLKTLGQSLGFIGEVHPQVLTNWELEKPVVVAEVNISEIFRFRSNQVRAVAGESGAFM